jgi:hypothetical protein
MTNFHPMYGELLNAREVSDLTGYTLNQLRYFKREKDKSPFPMLRLGGTTLYVKRDIDIWIEQNGGAEIEYFVPDGVASAGALNPTYKTENKEQFAQMAKITTRNAWSKWTEPLTQAGVMSIVDAYQFLEDETVRLYKLKHGEDLREKHPDQNMDFFLRKNDPSAFWQGRTWATRSLARTIYNWEISDEDILNAPIGEVPPPKID